MSKLTFDEKKKILQKLNKRITDTRKYLDDKKLDTEFFESRLSVAKNIDGVYFSSKFRISTKKMVIESISDKGFANLEKLIDTKSSLINRALQYIDSASDEAEDADLDWEADNEAEILNRAGALIKVYDDYGEAIKDYYHVRDTINYDTIVDEKVKEDVRGKVSAIATKISHKGTSFIGSSKVETNKAYIKDMLNDIATLVGGSV